MEYKDKHHDLAVCVVDALKGRGNLWTNRTTRKHINILKNKYGYDYQRMENLRQEIFLYFLRTEGEDYSSRIDRYKYTRASLQTYTNIVVLNFLRNRTKLEERKLEREGEHVSYDTTMEGVVSYGEGDEWEEFTTTTDIDYDIITTTPNPEELVIMKEWVEGLSSAGIIFLDYALGNIDRLEAMEALKISATSFHRRYNEWKKVVEKELETQGLVN